MDNENKVDMLDFMDILVSVLDDENLDAILQGIHDRYKNNICPVCHLGSELRDTKTNKTLKLGDDLTHAEWQELHEIDCPATLISEMRKK